MKMKQILFMGIVLLTANTVSAANYNYNYNNNHSYNQCCDNQGCDVSCNQCCDTGCNSCCDLCGDWVFSVDWLRWEAQRSGLDYAIKGKSNEDSDLPDGKIHSVDLDDDSGLRLALRKQCDCWDFGLIWTSFDSSKSNSVKSSQPNIFATRGVSKTNVPTDRRALKYARSKYEVDLDVYDLEWGYTHNLCGSCVSVRPFVGFEIAHLDQKIGTVYAEDEEILSGINAVKIREKIDMDAYGAYLGFQGNWNLGCNFSLFGDFSGAVLVGDFDIKYAEIDFTSGDEGNVITRLKKSPCQGISHWDAAIGLNYDFCECCGCVDFSLAIGYEIHQWKCLPDFIQTYEDDRLLNRNSSCLSFDGLFVRLNAAF